MGVAGSGKTTIGRELAARLGVPFHDGDDFHPSANVAKMAAGIPLKDEDRAGWLAALASLIRDDLARDQGGVIACSALKKKYRDVLRVDPRRVRFVYLKGDYDTIWARLRQREGHYMRAELLSSQFDDLEEPTHAIQVSAAAETDTIINSIMEKLMKKQYALGIMGLGVMGRSLALNFERHGYPVVGYDPKPHLPADFPSTVVDSPAALVAALDAPRVVLIMVPAGTPVDTAIASLKDSLQAGDIIIDGGNSYFLDTERRAKELAGVGLHFVGMGVSGGESGALWGPSLMPGGSSAAWARIRPLFESIAAIAPDGAPCVAWMGPGGAGHYVKMVHNGIEYGLMAAYAEGLNILKHANVGKQGHELDAETTPLRNAEHYQYEFNLPDITEVWRRGSVVASWLNDLTAIALLKNPDLSNFGGRVSDSGEGRWTIMAGIDEAVPTPVLTTALYSRFSSRGEAEFADKVQSAMRFEFGGHHEKPKA